MILAVALFGEFATPARASEVELPALAGHPRGRFPLPLYMSPTSDPTLDAVLERAIEDWKRLFHKTLGVQAFSRSTKQDQAAIRLAIRSSSSKKLMGETDLEVDDDGVIRLPVKISLAPPKQRGRNSSWRRLVPSRGARAWPCPRPTTQLRSTIGHVLRARNFSDPATRTAYIGARQHPSLRSVKGEFVEHYEAFWNGRRR
jgi:hypothetical protein